LDPKNPAGYTGEAYALLRAGDTEGSIKMIEAGLAACDASIDLLKALTDWAKQTKQADKFLPQLRTLAGRYPQAVALWQLVAEAAEAANRRDIAIDAIQKARALLPDNQEFAWDEARLWLDAGKSQKAYELFQLIPEADRLKTPTAIRGYVRALVGAGEEKRVPDIARETMKTSLKMKDPAYALAPALGLLDSPPTLARSVLADAIADSVYTQWSNSTETLRTRAQARLRVAENAIPRWSDVKVRSAIDALDRVQSHEPKDLWAPAMSAWLRVKSRQSTDLAWREIAPIVLAESKNEALPADVLEALGCVYFARDKYDDAIRVLKRAVEMAREPASPLIALALAYEKKGDHRAGREIFLRARGQTQTDRVRDEYKAAAPLFQEKAP
jgi:tetratricopeptide (TPR) repeat protein